MARGDCFPDGFFGGEKAKLDPVHEVSGPRHWAIKVLKHRARDLPWERAHDKGQWIVGDGGEPGDEIVGHRRVTWVRLLGSSSNEMPSLGTNTAQAAQSCT